MLESTPPTVWIALLLLVGMAGFLLGRRMSLSARRWRALQEELAAAREQGQRIQEELESYRGRVAEHFARTSEKLHDLTLQYRAVYDHLARGAGELCPEGFEKLEGGLGLDALEEEVPASGSASAGSGDPSPTEPADGAH